MPKEIDVTLQTISCDRNGFGGSIELSGNIFGATFMNDPDNPGDKKLELDIFPFPGGPITIAEGQTVAIRIDDPPRFNLAAPSAGPAQGDPRFLKIGGELTDGLGSNFFSISNEEPLPFGVQTGDEPPAQPRKFELKFTAPNLAVTLTFGLIVAGVF